MSQARLQSPFGGRHSRGQRALLGRVLEEAHGEAREERRDHEAAALNLELGLEHVAFLEPPASDTAPSSAQASCQPGSPWSSSLSFITDFLLLARDLQTCSLKTAAGGRAGAIRANRHPHSNQDCAAGLPHSSSSVLDSSMLATRSPR